MGADHDSLGNNGAFAIAITLLVLELPVPPVGVRPIGLLRPSQDAPVEYVPGKAGNDG